MKMIMKPVNILLEENKSFAQVAFLVDNPLVLADIYELRKQYYLDSPLKFGLYPLIFHFISLCGENPAKFFNNKAIEPTSEGFRHLIEEPERLIQYLAEHQDGILLGNDLFKIVLAREEKFITDITKIRRKYLYPSMFDSVIIQAVLFHEVKFFKTAYATYINKPAYSFEASEDFGEARDKILAIIATPYSTKKDILEAFKEGLARIRDVTESTHPLNSAVEKDTFNNIKRTRNWHWQQKSGRKYKELAEEFKIAQNSVERSVSRYRKILKFNPKN